MEDLFDDSNFRRYLKWFAWGALCIYIIPIVFLVIFKNDSDFSRIYSYSNSISGLILPLIAIGAAFLTFIAFWVQYKANKKQWEEMKNSSEASRYSNELTVIFDCMKTLKSNLDYDNIRTRGDVDSLLQELRLVNSYFTDTANSQMTNANFPINIFKIQLKYFQSLVVSIHNFYGQYSTGSANLIMNFVTGRNITLGRSDFEYIVEGLSQIRNNLQRIISSNTL